MTRPSKLLQWYKVKHIYNQIPSHNVDLLTCHLTIKTMLQLRRRRLLAALELYMCNYCMIGSSQLNGSMAEGLYHLLDPSSAKWTVGQVWGAWSAAAHMTTPTNAIIHAINWCRWIFLQLSCAKLNPLIHRGQNENRCIGQVKSATWSFDSRLKMMEFSVTYLIFKFGQLICYYSWIHSKARLINVKKKREIKQGSFQMLPFGKK